MIYTKNPNTIILLLFFLIITPFNSVFCNDSDTSFNNITADSYILIDSKTDKTLYKKNENKKMYPASTTKIVTAILSIENCNLDDIVTASYDAVMSIPEGYSSANIQIGEQLTVEQLLELLLVHSANDAANILAEHVGGSIESFVSMMNTRTNEIGVPNTHFTNSYGKHDENHYTTAEDLANIFKYCLKNETFRKIAGKASCVIPATNKSNIRTYTSTNELINPNNTKYYKYLIAGKTGFTTQAKECLVSASYKDNLELICVVLGSNNRFLDSKNMFENGYNNYSIKNLIKENDLVTSVTIKNATKDTKNLNLLSNSTIDALMENNYYSEIKPEILLNDNISAPIEKGTSLGEITYNIDGTVYTTELIAEKNVEKSYLSFYIAIFIISLILLLIIICLKKIKKKKFRKGRL